MWSPTEEHRARDRMCIEMLEGTTPHIILARMRHDEMDRVPAYDRTKRHTQEYRRILRKRLRLRHFPKEAA